MAGREPLALLGLLGFLGFLGFLSFLGISVWLTYPENRIPSPVFWASQQTPPPASYRYERAESVQMSRSKRKSITTDRSYDHETQ